MSDLKKILNRYKTVSTAVKASLIYTFASLLTKGLNIITTPIFTRIMSTEEIGVVTTFTSWFTILSVFANLSLNSGSFSVAMMEFKDKRDEYESSILTLSTISSLSLFVIYYFFKKQINSILGLPTSLIYLLLFSFIFLPATDFWMARQRYEYKYKFVAIISIVSTVLSSAIAILVVILARKDNIANLATYRLYGSNFVLLLVAICLYVIIMKKGKVYISKHYWKFALTMSLPLIVHTLSKHILDVSDRIMIANMVGNSAVGIYGILYSISSLSLIFWNAINASLIPYMFEKLQTGKSGEKAINNIIQPMLLLYSVICIILTLISPEVIGILATEEYHQAIYIMPPVAAGIYLTSIYNIFGNVLLYHKKTNYIMWATLCSAVVNVVLNYLLISKFGFIAAAYTTLVSYIVLSILQFIAMKKVHGYAIFDVPKLITISIVTIVACMLCNLIYNYFIFRYVIVVSIIVILFVKRKKIMKTVVSLKKQKDIEKE